ncbi:MAG: radical SAM family heme chaperone HemW [Acholeplasmatales bacterium]|nr:radical SAM family heme chaperone HemW [Acholeplasmatales bacterium]
MRGLYIHIPFCKSICTYCDFTKRVPKNKEMIKEYLIHLKEELLSYDKYFETVKTIYIGGGTPTLLDNDDLTYLFEMLKDFKKIEEFSIEINPETLTLDKVKILKKYGVNRCSIGVESFDPKILKILGRKHNNEDVYNAVKMLKDNGINNINIDLIFGVPGSDLSSIKNDLNEFYKLDINHLSYYSLILEENTILYHKYMHNEFNVIDNEIEAKMYEFIIDDLEKNGFKQYEISNFSKNNTESIHNKLYWNKKEYIGIGLGASGYLENMRYTNQTVLNEYYKSPIKTKEFLTKSDDFKEEMILNLRTLKGISIDYIKNKYDKDIINDFNDVKKYINDGFLKVDEGYLHLTKKGLLIANDIFLIFI